MRDEGNAFWMREGKKVLKGLHENPTVSGR
jgi:hypothetical protein